MPKFRKKPVVIEAVRVAEVVQAVLGEPHDDVPMWVQEAWTQGAIGFGGRRDFTLRIQTLEGVMIAGANDWIVRGVKGEMYPCKADIFAETYEALTRWEIEALERAARGESGQVGDGPHAVTFVPGD